MALPNLTLATIPKILYGTHQSIAEVSNSSLWFLPVLFISLILLDLILYLVNRKNLQKYLPFLLIFFLFISILIPPQTTIQHLLNGHPLAAILLFVVTYFALNNETNYVLMAENRYGNFLYFFIAAYSGTVASLLLSMTIAKYTTHLSKFFQRIGSDTMIIFILHKYPLLLFNELILLIPVVHISSFLIAPLYLTFALLICVPLSSAIKKYAPILTGKQTHKLEQQKNPCAN